MYNRIASRIRLAWGFAFVALASCGDSALTVEPLSLPPDVKSVQADTNDFGHIMLEVALSEPGTVRVEYWNSTGQRLRVEAPVAGTTGNVLLPRMEAGETYEYDVEGVTEDGRASRAITGSVSAPSLPPDLAELQPEATGTSTEPLTMLEVNATFRGFVAVDGVGKVVWWWRTQGSPRGFTRRANGNFVFNDLGHRLAEVTPGGDVVHELLPLPDDQRSAHHDVIATPQNTVLFISLDRRHVADSTLAGDAIWEWGPDAGASEKRWTTFDFYDPAVDFGTHSYKNDWVHANSLALGPHGNVILSLNWLDQVVSIAPGWRTLEWKLGGRGSTFAMQGDIGFAGQHTASQPANGDVMMFDNGRDRMGPAKYSRGLELALDSATHTARRIWEFRTSPDTYAPYVGSSRRLPNGNTLVCFGTPEGSFIIASGPIGVYEVRPDDGVAWRLSVADANLIYRATPLSSIANEAEVR